MATKYVCDRCDREVKQGSDLALISVPPTPNGMARLQTTKHELCSACVLGLADFVKPLAQEAASRYMGKG